MWTHGVLGVECSGKGKGGGEKGCFEKRPGGVSGLKWKNQTYNDRR